MPDRDQMINYYMKWLKQLGCDLEDSPYNRQRISAASDVLEALSNIYDCQKSADHLTRLTLEEAKLIAPNVSFYLEGY